MNKYCFMGKLTNYESEISFVDLNNDTILIELDVTNHPISFNILKKFSHHYKSCGRKDILVKIYFKSSDYSINKPKEYFIEDIKIDKVVEIKLYK